MVEATNRIELARLLASLETPEMVSSKVGNLDDFVGKMINIIGTRTATSYDDDGSIKGEYPMVIFEYDGVIYNMWKGTIIGKQIDAFERNNLLPIAGELVAIPTRRNDAYSLKASSIVECEFKIPELTALLQSRIESAGELAAANA